MKPLIGITSNYINDDVYFKKLGLGAYGQNYAAVAIDYFDAVKDAGGIPVIISPTFDKEYLKDLLNTLDGVLVSGGDDINPLRYNERSNGKVGRTFEVRDESDIFITKYALEKDMPYLGICRGMQILNVSLGGTLIQDIPTEDDGKFLNHGLVENEKYIGSHSVKLRDGSKLKNAYNLDEIYVNSYHHQGLKKLGKGLVAVGVTEDGLVEAVEENSKKFVVGTQWHPEMIYKYKDFHLNIFKKFVEACK